MYEVRNNKKTSLVLKGLRNNFVNFSKFKLVALHTNGTVPDNDKTYPINLTNSGSSCSRLSHKIFPSATLSHTRSFCGGGLKSF